MKRENDTAVSVVIPVYNDGERLGLALDALLGQESEHPVEIIVVDNGSTDDTGKVARTYQSNHLSIVRALEEFQIRGSYAARNKGIREATGEVIAFTDSDCLPSVTWLTNGLAALEREDADLAAGRIDFTFENDPPSVCEYVDACRKLDQRGYVRRARFGATANLFVRREVFEKHGLFRPDLKSGGDYEFGRRVTTAGAKLIYADDAVVYHPARSSIPELFRKTLRVGEGQQQLAKLGRLDHGQLSLRALVPVRRLPELPSCPPNGRTYVMGLLLLNALKYTNVTMRFFMGIRGKLEEALLGGEEKRAGS